MTNELTLVLAVASAAAFLGGVLAVWVTARRRAPVAPDPAEEGKRELELIELRELAERARRQLETESTHRRLERAQLEKSGEHVRSLEHQAATYLRQYAVAKDILRKELLVKSSVQAELAAANAEVASLRGRVSELQMQQTAADRKRVVTS